MSEEKRKRPGPPFAWYVFTNTLEFIALAEIVWYFTHDGQETFHEAASEWARVARRELRHYVSVRHTLGMIRDLPETQHEQQQ